MQKVVGSSPISRLPRKSTSPSNRAEGQASLISPRQACAGKRSPGSQTSSGGSCTAAEKIDEGTLPSARACSTWIRRLVKRLHRFLRQWETAFPKTDRTAGAVPIAQEHIGGADTPCGWEDRRHLEPWNRRIRMSDLAATFDAHVQAAVQDLDLDATIATMAR